MLVHASDHYFGQQSALIWTPSILNLDAVSPKSDSGEPLFGMLFDPRPCVVTDGEEDAGGSQ